MLNDGVVGNLGELGIGWGGSLEEQRALDNIPDLESVILLDDLTVDERYEEQSREDEKSESNSKSDTSDVPARLVVQSKSRRSLVDNGERADRAGNEEEDRGSPDSPTYRILADVHGVLDQREDDRAEDSCRDRCHTEAGEDGSQSGTIIPSPLHLASTDCGNTNTCDGRDERVGRGNMSGVASAPHDPDSGTSRRASECEKLDASVTVECRNRDDAVLDGRCSPSTDCEGTSDFEDQTEDHGLLVCDRAGGNTGGPRVCDIVCEIWLGRLFERVIQGLIKRHTGTVVVRLE